MNSHRRDDAQSRCSTSPTLCTTSLACGPKVGTGAGGGAGRSGTREQFGPEHGVGCDAGNCAAADVGAARRSGLEEFAFRMVTCSPHAAVARSGEAHAIATISGAARQSRNSDGRGQVINTTN